MLKATQYIVLGDGSILDKNGILIQRIPDHPNPFQYVRDFITNVRSTTYTENWEQLGSKLIITVA